MTPFTFETYLSQIDTAEVALRGRTEDSLFNITFGMTYNELIDDFIKGYLKSVKNKYDLKRSFSVPTYNPVAK